jgi:hypothetical protein
MDDRFIVHDAASRTDRSIVGGEVATLLQNSFGIDLALEP